MKGCCEILKRFFFKKQTDGNYAAHAIYRGKPSYHVTVINKPKWKYE